MCSGRDTAVQPLLRSRVSDLTERNSTFSIYVEDFDSIICYEDSLTTMR